MQLYLLTRKETLHIVVALASNFTTMLEEDHNKIQKRSSHCSNATVKTGIIISKTPAFLQQFYPSNSQLILHAVREGKLQYTAYTLQQKVTSLQTFGARGRSHYMQGIRSKIGFMHFTGKTRVFAFSPRNITNYLYALSLHSFTFHQQ